MRTLLYYLLLGQVFHYAILACTLLDPLADFFLLNVKNQFINRKEEVDSKKSQLRLLKQKLDTERGLMDEAITELDEFNKNRFQWPMKANKQCLHARTKRIGIDLVADDVDTRLNSEKDMLGTVSDALDEAFDAAVELSRQMDEASNELKGDIERKEEAARTDYKAERLSLNESKHLHIRTLEEDPKEATMYDDWKVATQALEKRAAENILTSKKMRAKMKKTQEDSDTLVKQHDADVFAALLKRTEEYDSAMSQDRKLLTEVKHEIDTVLHETDRCVRMIHDQEAPMKRATTRLHKREVGRTSPERTIDRVHDELLQEAKDITSAVDALKAEIDIHNQNLQDLRDMEIMLEEDLAIKTNSRKIEKKCIYLRSYFAKHKAEKGLR